MGHGFTLSGGNYTTVNYPDATTRTAASGINDTGTIVGWYYDGTKGHGFQAVPPPVPTPEPPAILLFCSGLMGLVVARRKFQK